MKKIVIISSLILIGLFSSWYFDVWHKPIEKIDKLVGKNYDYALKLYFKTEPDKHYKVNINLQLNEFDGGIYEKKSILTDTIVEVYTWKYLNYKKTIWVGKTKNMNSEIIDAIRYKNSIKF